MTQEEIKLIYNIREIILRHEDC